jgi:signal transduction histidine kinase
MAKAGQVVGKTLQMGDEGFERYIDELVEECARFIQLVAQLRQLSKGESPERDKLETEFFGSLAHLKEHSASLSEWVDQLIEGLPEEG